MAVSEEFAKCGVDIFICDPVASGDIGSGYKGPVE